MSYDEEAVAVANLHDEQFFRLASECTVEAWLTFLGHRWSALILYHLSQGPKRFGELSACLPSVTAKMMSERLLSLQRRELLERDGRHRDAAYRLTPKAGQLMPILDALERWARPSPE
ncbi:helix-turn-helix domain-containing protein [Sphingopyxis sp. JAI128]|uniref:winged helix-turn-helix transcriptional regulator n=1 Tax=Sphingopyxis sp. JAI128 TaxID=2723066 RepID=UPI0016138477|nr:helix-turn-helix domain-containing protein [Sphingopyxis sp. JAI128]MBB6426941.1 DNA-binding HxlR family transcriptional regulator [Sphingopyxis sp. JAI128]